MDCPVRLVVHIELIEFRCFQSGLVVSLRGGWCGGWVGERHVVMLSDLCLGDEGLRDRVIDQCVEPILADHAEWLMGVDVGGFADTPLGG